MVYKAILVDDERIIVEGISKVIDWASLQIDLVDTARNGIEAFEKIQMHKPHIVISDIKMPGMDGLQLVKNVYEKDPSIQFILLSGFSEFDYARTAMEYGVRNYLLKPCNEGKLKGALQEVIERINEKEEQQLFVRSLKETVEKTKPFMKAQMLNELLSARNGYRNYDEWFGLDINKNELRLILFQIEGNSDYEHLMAIQQMGIDLFENLELNTIVGKHALFLLEASISMDIIQENVEGIREKFFQYYQMDTTIAISGIAPFLRVRSLYLDALECLKHRFYLGEGSIITKQDILLENNDCVFSAFYDEQQLCMLIKSGNKEEVKRDVSDFFEKLTQHRPGMNEAKSHTIRLFLSILQTGDSENMQEGLSTLMGMNSIQQMKEYIVDIANEITKKYFERTKSKQSSVIQKVLKIMNEQLSNPELTLKHVANTMLYMNADYLGKVFKQETGERFSSYLTKIRINRAIEHISEMEDVKIVNLAEMIGFGDNPQYFSQVFKKHTGFTPTEYRKVP